jgi:hypothetical protein
MKIKKLLFIAMLLVSCGIYAQETNPPSEVVIGSFRGVTIPLRDFPTLTTNNYSSDDMIMIVNEAIVQESLISPTSTVIQNLQTEEGGITVMPPLQNFIGFNANESGGYYPPDPTGAVGPDHYIHAVNSAVKIFDKQGELLVGPVSLSSFLGNGSNNGDPIVLYDQLADRWFVSEFGAASNSLSIGISVTNDPTGSYYVYDYVHPNGFPDYPHYGLWHDGYYCTVNIPGYSGNDALVFEREVMLNGGDNPQMAIFSLPEIVYNPVQVKSPEPANLLGTTINTDLPGYFTYLQHDAWYGVDFDHIKVWELDMNWGNISSSTMSDPLEIPTDPFDAGEVFGNGNGALFQPGTNQRLAGHGGVISFATNFRQFQDHNSWLITFNTFIDNNDRGGIRWIELRNDEVSSWEIFQEGTYSIDDGHSRLMSSSAMDASGNIALAYTTGSNDLAASLRYTGRYDGDELGQMTIAEEVIINGPGVRTNSNRYGDYSHMTMDPDNFTFWYTGDYFSSNNNWRTQIAAFSLSGGFTADVGVNNIISPNNGILTNAEYVEIGIRNYGSEAQSDIPVVLSIDGNIIASEVFSGSINGGEAANYTFTQTVDLSNSGQVYVIEVSTNLSGDEFVANDAYTKEVIHLFSNDVGAIEITAPESGQTSQLETISFTLKNFGVISQSSFDVQYTINGGAPVIETFVGPITSEEEITFSFDQQSDLSEFGTYEIIVTTLLADDQDPSNDSVTVVIESVLCQPTMDCSFGDGFQLFNIEEINNPSECEGYGDFTNLIANLEAGSTNDLTVTTGYGDQYITVWIDYNDDSSFTNDEKVVVDYVIAPGEAAGSFTETFDLVVATGASPGEHRMRAKSNWQAPVPDDGCEESQYGETEDYTALVIEELNVEDYEIRNSSLIVTTLPNNQFEVLLNTQYDGGVFLGIFNILGQQVGFNKRVPKIDNAYKVNIDMTSMSAGVYLIRMGGHGTTTFKTARILVK